MKKRVFFILDWDFAYILSPIALELVKQEIIDSDIACLNVGRNYYEYLTIGEISHPFHRIYSLDEVYEKKIYNKKFFSEEEKVLLKEESKKIEIKYRKYGSLWMYVWADRNHIKEDYYSILHKLVIFFNFFEEIYKKEKMDLIITNAYASMPHLISYAVADKLGIKVVAPELFRIRKKTFLSSNRYKLLNSNKFSNIDQKSREEAKKIIKEYRENFSKPFYETSNQKRKKDILGGFKRFLNYSYNYYIAKLYTGHTKPNPFKKLYYHEILPRVKRKYFDMFYEFERNIDENEEYIYFPLHLQPEATTMTNAPMYINQIFVLEALSKSIPAYYMLYVKEHPNMYGNNKKEFYDTIKTLPNVKLFHPSVNSKTLIKNSKAVITITGTVGLEGLLLKKPVMTIGEVFYNDCKLVKKLKDIAITKWHDEIYDVLDNYIYKEEELIDFIALVLGKSSNMLFVEPGYYNEVLEKENIKNLIEAIKNEL